MSYHTYMVAYDGNWVCVVSAMSKTQAGSKALDYLNASGEFVEPEEIEVVRVPPGEVRSVLND